MSLTNCPVCKAPLQYVDECDECGWELEPKGRKKTVKTEESDNKGKVEKDNG